MRQGSSRQAPWELVEGERLERIGSRGEGGRGVAPEPEGSGRVVIDPVAWPGWGSCRAPGWGDAEGGGTQPLVSGGQSLRGPGRGCLLQAPEIAGCGSLHETGSTDSRGVQP